MRLQLGSSATLTRQTMSPVLCSPDLLALGSPDLLTPGRLSGLPVLWTVISSWRHSGYVTHRPPVSGAFGIIDRILGRILQRNSLEQTGASNQGLTLTVEPTTDLHRADLSEQYFHSNQDSQFQLLPGFPLHEKSDIQPTNCIFSLPCHDKVD